MICVLRLVSKDWQSYIADIDEKSSTSSLTDTFLFPCLAFCERERATSPSYVNTFLHMSATLFRLIRSLLICLY